LNVSLCVLILLQPSGTLRFGDIPTPHFHTSVINDSATRSSAVFEDEVDLQGFELTPLSMSRATGPQDPIAIQPPSRA
jgi:hypothetical protein